jgi:glycosyltransferase involved in cell wall biosynthesis
MRVLSCGGTSKGVGRIAFNYRRAGADFMITVCDLWPLDAREFEGLHVVSWMPVDCTPLSMLDQLQLEAARKLCASFTPVAMSRHGQAMMAQAGFDTPLVPHMLQDQFTTGDRMAWRREHGIPEDCFLISTVGVNGDFPCRKGFPELLCAFQVLTERHKRARLYMHTQISPGIEGVDLMEICKTLGLRDQVGWPNQQHRLADLHGADYMAGMMRASDVMCFPSLGEGFCVPAIEAMACGTPVIASRGSALTERVPPGSGWLVNVQPAWCKLHNRWWHLPLVADLTRCLENAYRSAHLMRGLATKAAAPYLRGWVMPLWLEVLEQAGHAP